MIGDEFGGDLRHRSPIKILGMRAMHDGSRRMELSFYHAAYPEGVRDKTYFLETIERRRKFILSRLVESEPVRLMLAWEVSADWMRSHFTLSHLPSREGDIQLWLNAHA
jgi:hypothetical protein